MLYPGIGFCPAAANLYFKSYEFPNPNPATMK